MKFVKTRICNEQKKDNKKTQGENKEFLGNSIERGDWPSITVEGVLLIR